MKRTGKSPRTDIPPRQMFEAAAGDFDAICSLLRQALGAALYPDQPNYYVSIDSVYADRLIVSRDGRYYAYPYTINDNNQVELGEPAEVVLDYAPVAPMREAQGIFVEAQDEKGLRWLIRVVRAGKSENNNYYSDAVLREAVPLFDGARVFVKSDDEHLKGAGKSFKNLIGRLVEPKFIEGKKPDTGEIRAVFEALESATDVVAKLREAWNRDMADDLFGFSIDALAEAVMREGLRVAKKFVKVASVDLIIEPGAGGGLINLLEAKVPQEGVEMKLLQRMLEAIKQANQGKLPDGLKEDDEEAVHTAYREAIQKQAVATAAATGTTGTTGQPAAASVTQEQLAATLRMTEARSYLRTEVAGSGLPDLAKARIRKAFETRERFAEADVDQAIKDEREYLARVTESGHVRDLGDSIRIEAGESQAEKVSIMLDAFFDPGHKEHRHMQSFKECYVHITGDRRVTGRLENCDRSRLREAAGDAFRESVDSTTFANVLGASLRRALIREYNIQSNYDVYQLLCDTVPIADFRTNERTRFGGYGDLPIVAERQNYGALASPTDEKATYAVQKRGGTEDVTIETIKNDDVGLVRRIPIKLGRAARRTLSKFVLDFIRTNPAIYDGNALYHATHNNLFTTALSLAEYGNHRLAMLKQTELNSADRVGIAPAYLWVPFDLEETATNLFTQGTENEKKFLSRIRPTVVGVWYWTDANDFATTADKSDIPFIELGFLDGQQEPDLFVQDNPSAGSLFANDTITYKIRHIYGGNVLEFRGTTKAVVP